MSKSRAFEDEQDKRDGVHEVWHNKSLCVPALTVVRRRLEMHAHNIVSRHDSDSAIPLLHMEKSMVSA